jgi:chromosome segregation ATPase
MEPPPTDLTALQASIAELQARLHAERETARRAQEAWAQRVAELEAERDKLRASRERLWQEVELFKRRLFIAKAERADDEKQLRLEYQAKLQELDALARSA